MVDRPNTATATPTPAAQAQGPAPVPPPAAVGRRGRERTGARAQAAPAPPRVEAARRERLARHAAVQDDLHRQRHEIDQAKLQLLQRRGQAQDQLRVERERLATRAWWRRPASQTTSSWVRTGGARATSVTPTPSASTTWPNMDLSMVANAGDMDQGEEETRTVRLVDPVQDDLSLEDITMDMDIERAEKTDEREEAMPRGRGRNNNRRYLDD